LVQNLDFVAPHFFRRKPCLPNLNIIIPMQNSGSTINFSFFFHLTVTILAWFGPFLFSWQLIVTAYILVQLQFQVFGKCLVNEQHDLVEEDDFTFYAYLFERMGFQPNRKIVKTIVRGGLYVVLAIFTVIWQVVLKKEALLF